MFPLDIANSNISGDRHHYSTDSLLLVYTAIHPNTFKALKSTSCCLPYDLWIHP